MARNTSPHAYTRPERWDKPAAQRAPENLIHCPNYTHTRVHTVTQRHTSPLKTHQKHTHLKRTHLSSPPSLVLLSTTLQRSEVTRSVWRVSGVRVGRVSSHTLLSDRLNSLYGTNARCSSSQNSRLQGTYRQTHTDGQTDRDKFCQS